MPRAEEDDSAEEDDGFKPLAKDILHKIKLGTKVVGAVTVVASVAGCTIM